MRRLLLLLLPALQLRAIKLEEFRTCADTRFCQRQRSLQRRSSGGAELLRARGDGQLGQGTRRRGDSRASRGLRRRSTGLAVRAMPSTRVLLGSRGQRGRGRARPRLHGWDEAARRETREAAKASRSADRDPNPDLSRTLGA